ncbi:hypothetical protein DP49_1187 [Burkholderia pseudomallei]|nr:hypothetical protein DP49_1187 [Burkholderia pseudomallei]
MAAVAELTDTISVAADAISTNFELQQPRIASSTLYNAPIRSSASVFNAFGRAAYSS